MKVDFPLLDGGWRGDAASTVDAVKVHCSFRKYGLEKIFNMQEKVEIFTRFLFNEQLFLSSNCNKETSYFDIKIFEINKSLYSFLLLKF